MTGRRSPWLALLLAALSATGCVTTAPDLDRPASWAQPVAVSGIPNLYRVDAALWRSALPRHPDQTALHALGIRTVVNLRRPGDDLDWYPAGIAVEHVPINTWDMQEAQILAALRLVLDPARQPVLVHCTHGADRTGLVVASYRVVVQGWSKQQALREMQRGGYGYHPIWFNLPRVLRRLDVVKLRRELGLPPAA